jgi:predicted HTH transcriptional regulator
MMHEANSWQERHDDISNGQAQMPTKRPSPSERLQRAENRTLGKMRQVEALLRKQPMTKRELAAEIDCSEKTIQRALRDITRGGGVVECIKSAPTEAPKWRMKRAKNARAQ